MDITFGDYLRALITADADLVPDDPKRYRLAFIEAFRERGIYPLDVRTLSEDSLRWRRLPDEEWRKIKVLIPSPNTLRTMAYSYEARQALVGQLLTEKSEIVALLAKDRFDKAEERFLQTMWPAGGQDQGDKNEPDRRQRYLLSQVFAVFLHQFITHRVRSLKTGRDSNPGKIGRDAPGTRPPVAPRRGDAFGGSRRPAQPCELGRTGARRPNCSSS